MEELPGCDTPWVKGGPVGPADTLIISCWWLMREIETSALNLEEVTIDTRLKRAELRLSCSKNDCRAVGVGRTHGCLCDPGCTEASAIRYCPFHAVARHRERIARLFPDAGPEDPFFPNEHGERGTKAAFQGTVGTAAEFLNLPTRGP